ncbi:MAG: hypothetical protein MUC60_10825 [Oscillatoria sp. Prado101]|nr:hypothetical protein [Oscillatoria sp. Prado101]
MTTTRTEVAPALPAAGRRGTVALCCRWQCLAIFEKSPELARNASRWLKAPAYFLLLDRIHLI